MQSSGTRLAQAFGEPAPAIYNRRRCVRQKVHSPAYAGLKRNSSETLPDLHEIFEMSIRGLSFQSPAQLSPGQQLSLRLDFFETGESVETNARVVWSEPSGRSGVRFRKISTPAFHQLREWLFFNMLVACAHYAAAQARRSPAETVEATPESRTSFPFSLAQTAGVPLALDPAVHPAVADIKRDLEARELGLDSALHLLAERARMFTGATGAAIAISRGAEMVCRASAGSTAPCIGTRFQPGAGFSGECVRRGVSLRCDDAESDARVERESCQALGIRSILASPLRADDSVIGLLEVFSERPNAFNANHGVFLEGLAEIAVAAAGHRAFAPADASAVHETPELAQEVSAANFEFREAGGGSMSPERPDALDAPEMPSSSNLRSFLIVAAIAALMLAAVALTPVIRSRLSGVAQPSPQAAVPQKARPQTPALAGTPGNEMDRLHQLAEQGDATAQFAMGAHYAVGDGVAQDYSTAARWFTLAANQGNVAAQATLGAYHWAGTGVPKDLDEAYFWSLLAEAGGDKASKYRLPALASGMSRRRVIAEQERADEWLRSRQLAARTAANSSR
jgi:GAF domain/PilZ domain/Sel1 repeat